MGKKIALCCALVLAFFLNNAHAKECKVLRIGMENNGLHIPVTIHTDVPWKRTL